MHCGTRIAFLSTTWLKRRNNLKVFTLDTTHCRLKQNAQMIVIINKYVQSLILCQGKRKFQR